MFNEKDVRHLFIDVVEIANTFIIAEGLRTTSYCSTSKGMVRVRIDLLKEGEYDRQNLESPIGDS